MMYEKLSDGDPRLAAEWDYKENAPLRPQDVSVKSRKKVKWVCATGHHYTASVYQRAQLGMGCPYDSGLLHSHYERECDNDKKQKKT